MEFTKHEKIILKNDPNFSEAWVQDIIAKNPSIIGLGDLEILDKERIQPRKGRLDFLMQELNREANTLSSKSIVVETTQNAVELKVLIEQMREQIQNIE